MRAINLFPWREKKRKKQNQRVLCWMLGLASTFLLTNLIIALIYQQKIDKNLLINSELNLRLTQLHCQMAQACEKNSPTR